MTEQEYLQNILEREKIPDYLLNMIRSDREEIESLLRLYFWAKIENFYYSWSIARGTAIKSKYDTDLCVYFWNTSFSTLKEMYTQTKQVLWRKYVTKEQRVSIWLTTKNIDVVPWRKIDSSWTINLYDSQNDTWKQTNIVLHKNYISEKWDKDLIKLIKLWKFQHEIDVKSFALEILTINALKDKQITGLGNKLRHVWKYIRDVDIFSLQIIDPANRNNNIMDSVDYLSKQKLQNKAKEALIEPYWSGIIK